MGATTGGAEVLHRFVSTEKRGFVFPQNQQKVQPQTKREQTAPEVGGERGGAGVGEGG